MAFHEDRQPDMMQHGHQPGMCLADPQGAAGTIEPQVMSQQHADRLCVQVPDAFEIDDDMAGRRLVEQGVQVPAQDLDCLVVIEVG